MNEVSDFTFLKAVKEKPFLKNALLLVEDLKKGMSESEKSGGKELKSKLVLEYLDLQREIRSCVEYDFYSFDIHLQIELPHNGSTLVACFPKPWFGDHPIISTSNWERITCKNCQKMRVDLT